jgi:hypothetical protein
MGVPFTSIPNLKENRKSTGAAKVASRKRLLQAAEGGLPIGPRRLVASGGSRTHGKFGFDGQP